LHDYPSRANSKNAVLIKYLMGRWWGLLRCSANSVRASLPLQPLHSLNYHGKDSHAIVSNILANLLLGSVDILQLLHYAILSIMLEKIQLASH